MSLKPLDGQKPTGEASKQVVLLRRPRYAKRAGAFVLIEASFEPALVLHLQGQFHVRGLGRLNHVSGLETRKVVNRDSSLDRRT